MLDVLERALLVHNTITNKDIPTGRHPLKILLGVIYLFNPPKGTPKREPKASDTP